MKTTTLRNALCIFALLITAMVQSVNAQETSVLRSAIFPGMGQLGNGQTAKGLLYMVGEVALLSLTIDNIAKAAANARGTQYDSVAIFHEGGDDAKRTQQLLDWQKRADDNQRTKMMALGFGGLAAAWWAWNIIDGIIFVPQQSDDLSLYENVKNNTVVSVGLDGAKVNYSLEF